MIMDLERVASSCILATNLPWRGSVSHNGTTFLTIYLVLESGDIPSFLSLLGGFMIDEKFTAYMIL